MGMLALSTIRDRFSDTNTCELGVGRYVIPVGNEDIEFAQSVQDMSPWDRFGFVLNPLFLPTGRTFSEVKSGRSTVEFNPLKGRAGQVVLDVKDKGFTIVVSEASLIRTTVAQVFAAVTSSPSYALELTAPVCFLDISLPATNDKVDLRPKSTDEVVKLFNARKRAGWEISLNDNVLKADLCSFKSATPKEERIHYLKLFPDPSGGITYKMSPHEA